MMNHADVPAPRSSRQRKPIALVALTAMTAMSLLAGCSSEEPETAKPKRPDPVVPSPEKSSKAPEPKAGGFSPYVDTSLSPAFNLIEGAEETGVKEFNLAFVSPGGGCVPKWGGRQALAANPVAQQADELRAEGGDVRVSFGGQSGNELARVCGSVDKLVNAYRKVVDAYHLTKVDFDIEGPALTDTKANRLRAQAIARLQQDSKLDVSFTLPVLPSGLNRHAVAVLQDARKNGARISTVNVMAMDYGTYYDGDMGTYAIQAATATQKQIKGVLGIRDEATAWKSVSVTPMIGVNDVKGEVFRPDDAAELKKFAEEKGLGHLSMWSMTRDKPCPGGATIKAQATCSSIGKKTNEFVRAFAG
ncbi:chitinase [Streptomyces sp. NPDC058773]|uniref:chitinase n=1 Tax=Streptomyces sp. NPDC058773 TaxID=3346632 RepID=UPI003685FA04